MLAGWPWSEGKTLGKDKVGPEGPAPSVLLPAATLGLLLSRALSSEQAPAWYGSTKTKPSSIWMLKKRKNLGGLGAEPPTINSSRGATHPVQPSSISVGRLH